jgi:hypothetical protein
MSGLNTPGEPDSPDDPDLAEIVGGGASAFGIAVVVSDAERQDIGEVAVLTLVPSVTAHTGGSQLGAEVVDVLISRMLAEGFALVDSFTPAALLELPTPDAWRLSVSEDGMRIAITEPDGAFYLGEMGASPPPGWYDPLAGAGRADGLEPQPRRQHQRFPRRRPPVRQRGRRRAAGRSAVTRTRVWSNPNDLAVTVVKLW